jgi:hypothetical protein
MRLAMRRSVKVCLDYLDRERARRGWGTRGSGRIEDTTMHFLEKEDLGVVLI